MIGALIDIKDNYEIYNHHQPATATMIHPESIDACKEAARIDDVVGRFVTLKKSGVNLVACCPFHSERSPSFTVNPARGIFKCFGCGKGGDTIAFLREQGMDYVQAIRWIAEHYKIELKETPNGKPDPDHDRRTQFRTTAAVVQAHFALQKVDDNPGREYWTQRGFTAETLDVFGIGYCDGTKPAHIPDNELRALGLLNEAGNMVFYRRSMIPIHDRSGNVAGWAGRTLETAKETAKYINSPETLIYHKKRTLFNLHRAAPHIRRTGVCWIVEGYADAIALWQSGIKNAVALCGTALTDEQTAELRRFNGDKALSFILCLDNETRPKDDGYKAAVAKAHQAALEKLLPIGEVRQIEYPKACKDMADVVHRGIAPDAVEKKDALVSFITDNYEKDTWTAVQKAEFQDVASRMLAEVKRDNVRSIYINQVCNLLEMSARDLNTRVKEFRTEKETEEKNKAADEYRYIKVLDDYYQRMVEYDIFTKGKTVVYRRRKRQELCTEGVSITAIERFHDWICEPSHLNYRRIIEINETEGGEKFRFFNSYQPLPYRQREFELPEAFYRDPEKFDIEQIPEIRHIAAFMKHIFDWKTYRQRYLTIGWDWLALCYLQPTQRLPALCLVSADEGTGKSTFINLILALFGPNATKTEADRIGSNFNAMTGGKVIQCVEETKDERGDIGNKLKDLITSFEKVVEAKHQDARVVKSFDKYIFASNHEDGFMKVGTGTTRFFVMKVNQIENPVPDFEEKLYLEIPYLLYFLQKRGVLTPKTNRLWFDPKLLENEALLKLRHASKDQVQQIMEELFLSIFLRCELTDPIMHVSSQYLKLLMCAYGGKVYEQKSPVYFQNTAVNDMRLVYRSTPTGRETVELINIHSDTWINAAEWKYERKRAKTRFIEIPIWRFVSPTDAAANYTTGQLDEIQTKLFTELPTLEPTYGAEPAAWLELLAAAREAVAVGEMEVVPF